MSEFGIVEDTMFIPMVGRIYATEKFPGILYDKKALSLKEKLPSALLETGNQSQYTLLASASRSANMDRHIQNFLKRKPDGVVIQLGCGLETTYDRNDNGQTQWYAVDLPNIIEYRRSLLPEPEKETYLSGDAFSDGWLRQIRRNMPDTPFLVTAGGLFHYFQEEKVLGLLQMLKGFGNIELVFDTVNKSGMKMLQKKYMKQMGHENARMFFYVNSAEDLVTTLGGGVKVLADEPYYKFIKRDGLKIITKISMDISDRFGMLKMIHLEWR